MRTLILHTTSGENSYADCLFRLLLQFFTEQGYVIKETTGFSEAKQIHSDNEKTILVIHSPRKKSSFFSNLQLNSFVKKHAFQWLIQTGDNRIIPSRLPQFIVLNNIEKMIGDATSSQASFAVGSRIAKQMLIEKSGLSDNAIHIIPAFADGVYQPITWSEQQSVKMHYTQGREYFLVNGYDKTPDSFTALLKAFSAFKKWQHSSMKLVVNSELYFTKTTEWQEKIGTYKYRDDVVILNDISATEQILLLASAYSFIHTPAAGDDVIPLLQAMQCETPCISFITDTLEEYTDDAAVLIEPDNYDAISEKMILLYKDENLRSTLIAKGKQRTQQYTKDNAIAALKNVLPVNP